MRRALIFAIGWVVLTMVAFGQAAIYRNRWVYVSTDLHAGEELTRVENIARIASENGWNGILLSPEFDAMNVKTPEVLDRLARFKEE